MTLERVLIGSVIFLAIGLGLIFGYTHGTVGFSAAYPTSGASLQVSLNTTGTPAMAGVGLTLLGLVLLLWALVEAILRQMQGPPLGSKREGSSLA